MTFPRTHEDHLLARYWEANHKRGLMYVEVQLGRDGPVGKGGSQRAGHWRMDAVYLPHHPANEVREWSSGDSFVEDATGQNIEIIEAKRRWNTDVIGQAIAGAHLVARAIPHHGLITKVVIVDGAANTTLEHVCDKLGIHWHRLIAYPTD